MITVHDLTYHYQPDQAPILDHLNLTVADHQWLAIIGRNGSGKSTLARLIAGLLPTPAGTVTVNGFPVDEEHLGQIHQEIGLVFQNPDNQFVGTTVEGDVAFGLENHRVDPAQMPAIIDRALAAVGMSDFRHHQPDQLSGGQKQRVALAGALALQPRVLILDEATSMLDPIGRQQVLELLGRLRDDRQLTIISITHDPAEVALADQVAVLDQGKIIAQDEPAAVLNDRQLVDRVGLVQPLALRLRDQLQASGVALPKDYLSEEELLQWLNQRLNTTA